MVKAEKFSKFRSFRMPHFKTTPWYLPGVPKGFFMMLLLMLMYDTFLGKISRKPFCPMILGSPIVSHFLAILRDVHDFPFFSTSEHLRILAHCGHVLHLVRKICGKNSNRPISFRVMQITLDYIVRRTFCNPKIVSSIEKSIAAIMGYPLMLHKCYICISVNFSYMNDKNTIWEKLAVVKSLSDPPAGILNMTIVGFTACQQRRYQNINILIIFRRLFAMRNKLFVLLCNLTQKYIEYWEKGKSNDDLDDFRDSFKSMYKKLRKNPDFPIFAHYMTCLSNMCLTQEHLSMSMFNRCLILIEFFSQNMNDARELCLLSRILSAKNLEVVFQLLDENPGDLQIEGHLQLQSDLKYPLLIRAEGSSCRMDIFKKLKLLHSFDPEQHIYSLIYICDDQLKTKSKLARLLLILFMFISFVKSNDEHLSFICEWFIFMKDNKISKCPTLALFLDLQRGRESHVFHDVLSYFCKFAISSMRCSEMTERTFLSFFEMIVRVISHEQFVHRLQVLLEIPGIDVESLIDDLNDFNFSELLDQIKPFRKTHCYCSRSIDEDDEDDDDGVCWECKREEDMSERLEEWEKQQHLRM